MNASYCTLLRAAFVVIALSGSAAAPAIEESNRDSRMPRLVDETRDALQRLRRSLSYVDVELIRRSERQGGYGRPGTFDGGMPAFRDLEREAERISSIGNKVREIAAQCGEDGRRVGADYSGLTRRLLGTVKRIGSASSAASAQMSTSRAQVDADAVEQRLGALVQLQGCVKEADDDEEEESDGEKESEKDQKEEEGDQKTR